jgi:glutamate racemase
VTLADNRPIGVFDSGVGGLTVLRALHEQLPEESTIYLGDLARCPYGPRQQWQVRQFAEQIADYLAADYIKLLIVACNTATAAAYHHLRGRYPFPVLGVIDPGAASAVRLTKSGRIGVIATDGTVASGAYRNAVLERLPSAEVVERSASWLVPLIERGSLARMMVARELAPTLAEMRELDIDTLILGCTHFPLVRDIFEAEIGPKVTVVDSAVTTASEAQDLLDALDAHATGEPTHRLLVTGPAEAFAERSQAMFRASPQIETVELLPHYVS